MTISEKRAMFNWGRAASLGRKVLPGLVKKTAPVLMPGQADLSGVPKGMLKEVLRTYNGAVNLGFKALPGYHKAERLGLTPLIEDFLQNKFSSEKRAFGEDFMNWWRGLGNSGFGSNLGQQMQQFQQNRAGGSGASPFRFSRGSSAPAAATDHSAPSIFSRGFQNIYDRMNSRYAGTAANAPSSRPAVTAPSLQGTSAQPAPQRPVSPPTAAQPAPSRPPTDSGGAIQVATRGRQLASQYGLPVGKNPFASDAEAQTWMRRNPILTRMARGAV